MRPATIEPHCDTSGFMAVQGFKSKALQRFSEQDDARRLPKRHLARIADILAALDDEDPLDRLRDVAAYRLHRLTGDRKGVWSVRVAARLRITFRYNGRDAYDIDLTQHYGD